jgi:hypothetical protein
VGPRSRRSGKNNQRLPEPAAQRTRNPLGVWRPNQSPSRGLTRHCRRQPGPQHRSHRLLVRSDLAHQPEAGFALGGWFGSRPPRLTLGGRIGRRPSLLQRRGGTGAGHRDEHHDRPISTSTMMTGVAQRLSAGSLGLGTAHLQLASHSTGAFFLSGPWQVQCATLLSPSPECQIATQNFQRPQLRAQLSLWRQFEVGCSPTAALQVMRR